MNSTTDSKSNEVSLRDQIRPFLSVWPWVLLSVIMCLFLSGMYLRYTTKKFEATASIIIKDTQFGGGLSETGVLGDIGLFGSNFNSVENEIEILNSKRLLSKVIDHFKLDINYYRKGNVKSSDVYESRFLDITQLKNDSLLPLRENISFFVKKNNDSLFGFKSTEEGNWVNKKYGEIITIDNRNFLVTPKNVNNLADSKENNDEDILHVVIHPKSKLLQDYHSRLNVVSSSKRGSVVNLSITDVVGDRAADVLDQLIEEYNKDAINDKNIVAENTAAFIEERLKEITKDLDSVETGIKDFKTSVQVVDIEVETAIDLEKVNQIEAELLKVETQLSIGRSLKEFMVRDLEKTVTTAGLGINDIQLNQLIGKYNEILTTFQRVSQTSTSESPVMIQLTSELTALKRNIFTTLDNYINNLKLERNSLAQKANQINATISRVPSNEKTSRNIKRNREVVEAIYLILREKQETTAISLAVTAPKAKIVDSGYASENPISPKPKIILLAGFILGVMIPIGIVYLKQLFYNKIESRMDLERALPEVTILGEIPKLERGADNRIVPNDRSVLAESFRIIRTNIQYKLNTLAHKETPVVLVTSTVKGEGKTLTAFNLASTFAYSGKKVLLIGGDIRNPQLHRFFNRKLKHKKGLTDYLVTNDFDLNDLVFNVDDNPKLSILQSGTIPPNPAELLMQDRIMQLFDEAKSQYDMIIVDTAPTILVTDTFLINKYADVTVYVSRANYTDLSLLDYISDTLKAEKLSNIAMVINSVKLANFGYGNKYGYTYSADKQSTLSRLKSKLGF